MLPASQDVRSDGFATGESSSPDFQQFATNAVGCLAASTSIFIAIIILSRRIAGGLTSQPSISVLFLAALVGGGLIAAANNARPKWLSRFHWLVTATRCSVLVTLLTLGIWLPLLTSTTFATIALAGVLVFLPSHRSRGKELTHVSLTPYWTALIDLQQSVLQNTLNILRFKQADSNPFVIKKNYLSPWWKIFRQDKQNAKQLVPLENFLSEQAISRPTTRHQSGPKDTLLHWQERYKLPDGTEYMRGQLMIAFSAGTRLTTGHVGFCPAFQSIPIVEVTTDYDALEVSVKAAEILPWGVRIECRVEEPIDEGTSIPVFLSVNEPLESGTS